MAFTTSSTPISRPDAFAYCESSDGSSFGDAFEWVRGDTEPFQFTVKDEAGEPVDITGFVLWFTVKASLRDDSPALIEKKTGQGITVPDASTGEALVFLSSAETEALTPGRRYYFDIQAKTAAGFIQTIHRGIFITSHQVTNDHS